MPVGIEAFESSGPPIFAGNKTVSVRDFPLPSDLVGKPIVILAIPDGSSALPDAVKARASSFKAVGVVVFSESKGYGSRAAFEADTALHGMTPGSALHAKYAGTEGSWPESRWRGCTACRCSRLRRVRTCWR